MKKMMNIVIVLMIASSAIPLVYADQPLNTTSNIKIDTETQTQVEVMKNGLGAEIRLLQLEKSIIRNICIGEEILSFLGSFDVNTTDLELILAEFDLLKQEIQSVDLNNSEAVNIFVDLKHDATNLTKEFRETLRGLTNRSSLNQLTDRIRNMTCNQTQNLSESIKNKIRLYNKNQFHHIYQLLGKNETSYLNQYQNGSITRNQVKQNISLQINKTQKSGQFRLLKELKQEKIKYKIQTQNRVQNASGGFQERQENRLKKRLQKLENNSDYPFQQQLMNKIQNNIHDIENTGNGENQGGAGGSHGGSNGGGDPGDNGNGPIDNTDEGGQDNNGGANKPGRGG